MAETVAVIIPVYNGAAYLKETLGSVFGQTRPPEEVIVVDDGSSDESLTIARGYPRINCISQGNAGVATARNVGIRASRSSTVAFLDQDDCWAPEKLELQLAVLEERAEVDYVTCHQVIFIDKGVERPAWLKPDLLESPQAGNIPSALAARRALFDQIGYFDPVYPTASDADWFFRAKDAGIKTAVVGQPLVYKRIHSDNQSNLVESQHSELLRIARQSILRSAKK